MMQALTESRLYQVAPSIFAKAPHERVSDKYGFVPTIDLVHAFQQEGWHPVRANQTRVRDLSRREYTRHAVRFRRLDDPIQVGDSLAELVLSNSHDGSAAYRLDAGLFRLCCLNGLVTPIGETGGIRVRHGKQIVDEVIEGSYELVDEVPKLAASVDRFLETQLSAAEGTLYAQTALEARYGAAWQQRSSIEPEQLLEARRSDDRGDNLWVTFNRVQENLIRGGLSGRSKRGRKVRTRPIKSVTEDLRLNRALWRLADRFAELKAA